MWTITSEAAAWLLPNAAGLHQPYPGPSASSGSQVLQPGLPGTLQGGALASCAQMDKSNDPSRLRLCNHFVPYSWIPHTCQAWGWRLRTPQAPWNFNSLSPSKPWLLFISDLDWTPFHVIPKHSTFVGIITCWMWVILLICFSFPLRQGLFPIYLCIPRAWHRAWVSVIFNHTHSLSLSIYIYWYIQWKKEWLNRNTTSHRLQMVIHQNKKIPQTLHLGLPLGLLSAFCYQHGQTRSSGPTFSSDFHFKNIHFLSSVYWALSLGTELNKTDKRVPLVPTV